MAPDGGAQMPSPMQPFFCQHDILLPADPQTDDELDAMIEGVLGAAGESSRLGH